MPLTLAKETMDMNWKDAAASGSSQILLEGDMIVPDSKPDLQEILRCQGNVKIREKRVTDDRISFSGDLEISVLYRAKNGERPLYAMQASLPLEDFLHIDGLEKDMDGFWTEWAESRTPEAALAHDADQLDLIFNLKAELDKGNAFALEWLESAVRRLTTPQARLVAAAALRADHNRWWYGRVEKSWWVNRK